MGLLKLVIAGLVIGAIYVIINEYRKHKKEIARVKDLNDEIDTVNNSLNRTDIEEDLIDAKTELKSRRADLAKKTEEFNAPIPPAGRTRKEGEQPPKPDTTVEAPEFDTTTESFKPTKVAPKKKVAKKKVAKKKVAKKKASPKTGKK